MRQRLSVVLILVNNAGGLGVDGWSAAVAADWLRLFDADMAMPRPFRSIAFSARSYQ
ncbi:hypothetical protein GFY24_33650 [Nocardia sp. SYP-A9097]|uniref:hypothetical protein n=1 Tax=Nocardia sp. SYP-A9097 TaxID=2663237 RepID=UPI00129AAAD7|nr:hypothetical protein [Nocardia sp. SYP-A9097]MRH92321.1 hypothetical protein [Nocardia sp. SYP-A9097]